MFLCSARGVCLPKRLLLAPIFRPHPGPFQIRTVKQMRTTYSLSERWDESIERPYFVREDGMFSTPGMVELSLPYFKRGDDFAAHLKDNNGDIPKALRSWSKDLKGAADELWCTADILDEAKKNGADDELFAQAGTHHASISCLSKETYIALLKHEGTLCVTSEKYWMDTLRDCRSPEEKKQTIEGLEEYFKDMQFLLEEKPVA
ncbi:hypothetical protein SpCBS45565_g01966 [Spizellomyces sp. 'palustris']|nr:hypothetical protein SpCBS45565_g01966 [Spizellomyces sp. 'palustris']